MEQVRTSERRSDCDRRTTGTYLYTGPERREFRNRRSGRTTVCIDCGKVCGNQRGWVKGILTKEAESENLIGMCPDCSSKRVQKFHSDN